MSKKDITEAAKEVRRVLKAAYPDTKFSVRVSRFSGGSSVEVEWIDGPTQSEVEEFTAPCKGYYNEYINTNRHISVEAMEAATKAAAECYGIPTPQVQVCTGNPYLDDMTVVDGEPICDVVHRAVHATSLYGVGYEVFSGVFQSEPQRPNERCVDWWVKFYQGNPDQLRGFIETANEQVERMAARITELEMTLAAIMCLAQTSPMDRIVKHAKDSLGLK